MDHITLQRLHAYRSSSPGFDDLFDELRKHIVERMHVGQGIYSMLDLGCGCDHGVNGGARREDPGSSLDDSVKEEVSSQDEGGHLGSHIVDLSYVQSPILRLLPDCSGVPRSPPGRQPKLLLHPETGPGPHTDAGDVCEEFFLKELQGIARTRCVQGNLDNIKNLEIFIKFTIGRYNIGVIHILPDNLEEFTKKHDLQILIFGHTHQPMIKGTNYNVLLLNPGSPTKPKAPIERPGFMKPIARPSVITLSIDENDILSTFIINIKV